MLHIGPGDASPKSPLLGGFGTQLNKWFRGPSESIPQTAPRSVQPFLYGSRKDRCSDHATSVAIGRIWH